MKKIIVFLALYMASVKITAQQADFQQDTVWCIQILATRNPHLLKPEMISVFPDTAMVEVSGDWYRIMFVYPDKEQADIHLYSWQRQHSSAYIVPRTKKQIQTYFPLFSKL